MNGNYRVCVVGAGPGGLAMARALKRHGIAYDHFERHSDVGGIWDQSNPGGPMYDGAHMISSKSLSAFAGFPMPADYPDYPGHRQVAAYLRAFADAFGLRQAIRFSTAVERADRSGDGWMVTARDSAPQRYDGVVAATGLAWHPRMPDIPGRFDGETIHSSQYRSPDLFKGRRVLILGAGNSGVDIASDAARSAASAFISLRRGYHFIPKYIFGMPADVFAVTGSLLPMRMQQLTFAVLMRLLNGDVRRFGLPKPDHLPLSSHPIVNSTALLAIAQGDLKPKPDVERFDGNDVVFRDGSQETIDLVVAATGYVHRIPFADPALIGGNGRESDLFLRSVSRREPTFAAIGFLEVNGGVYPFYDEFADVIARYHKERAAGSAKAAAFEAIVRSGELDVSGSVRYVDSPRHKVYANVLATLRVLRKLRRRMGWPRLDAKAMRPATDA